MRRRYFDIVVVFLLNSVVMVHGQRLGSADNGNGSYTNPVLHADYSDPDVIRVGNDYYLVSSSFADMPGLPILHSRDMINWRIIGHAIARQLPADHFSVPQHGNGVWAPSLRFHKGEFYLYYPDPDYGLYLTKAKNAAGPWSEPVLVEAGKGLIDPCPLWDDDGSVYLVHAWAGSRAGIKSILTLKRLSADGSRVTGEGRIIYDGHETDPTIEGPKIYKRNGYYYILAPAGGVSTGWQLALRSRNIAGPYERKVVMDQGTTNINGPHQGAWVNTPSGDDWFFHFQDKGAYGRVLHLQPVKWMNDWPVIGKDDDGDGKGEPVTTFKKPATLFKAAIEAPADSDEFTGAELGAQWQWQANPASTWAFMNAARGVLRLYSANFPDTAHNLWERSNVLLQKLPAESFEVRTKLEFHPNPKLPEENCGLVVMGMSYASIGIVNSATGLQLVYNICKDAAKGSSEIRNVIRNLDEGVVYLRMKMTPGANCVFGFSLNGTDYTDINETFAAQPGRWTGAKIGLYCTRSTQTNDSGYADVDWFRFSPLNQIK